MGMLEEEEDSQARPIDRQTLNQQESLRVAFSL